MEDFTRAQLQTILRERRFADLVGEYETVWLEAKVKPYNFDHDDEKAEFAKDVSSLANSDGGYLLIGVDAPSSRRRMATNVTKLSPDAISPIQRTGDQITSIPLVHEASANPEACCKVLDSWIYPRIDGLEVYFLSSNEQSKRGLLVVEVPIQEDSTKPFLYHDATRQVSKKDSILFGWAERVRANSQRIAIKELQEALRGAGRSSSSLFETVRAAIRAERNEIEQPGTDTDLDATKERHDNRLKGRALDFGLADKRTLALTSFVFPRESGAIFHDPHSIQELLERYTVGYRKQGWKLLYTAEVKDRTPELIETKWGDVRAITVYADGSVIFVCDLDYIFFLSGERDGRPPDIIPIALVEVVYHFASFVAEYHALLQLESKKRFIAVYAGNMVKSGIPVTLAPGPALPNQHRFRRPSSTAELSAWMDIGEKSAEVVAVEMLRRIYELFGLSEEQIPYTMLTESGIRRIDSARILDQG